MGVQPYQKVGQGANMDYLTCPNCGRQNPTGASFCASCGTQMGAATPEPQAAPPVQTGQGSPARQQIVAAIQGRTQTDALYPTWWVILPLLASAVSFFLGIFYWPLMLVGSILSLFIYAFLAYKLTERINNHIHRELSLRYNLIVYIKEKAAEQYRQQAISPQVAAMESINLEASYKEQEHSALGFAILALIPIVNLYVLYVLTKFTGPHDQRWNAFTQNAQYCFQQMGMGVMAPSWRTIPERSFLIYFLLTILTLGLFLFYWLWKLIDDPNDHFATQWQFEDSLMLQLR